MTKVANDCDERGMGAERRRATDSGGEGSGGRRLLTAYGIALAASGLILAAEPEHSRPWRTLGVLAAVLGLLCVLAPLARRTTRPARSDVTRAAAPTPAHRAGPPAPAAAGHGSTRREELDRVAAELAEAQVRIDLQATDLAVEQGRLDQRAAVLRARQSEVDERRAALAQQRAQAADGAAPT